MDEEIFEETRNFLKGNIEEPVVVSGIKIVANDFGVLNRAGFTKVREHTLYKTEFELDTMMSVLSELFPSNGT